MQNQCPKQTEERPQTQLNIAIDSTLHQALRIQAFMRKQSLREFSEGLLRAGIDSNSSHAGQSIAPESRSPVKKAG